MWVPLGLLLATVAFVRGSDALGLWVLHRMELSREDEISAYRKATSAPRPIVGASATACNGAASYRQALANVASHLSESDALALGRDFDNPEALEGVVSSECDQTALVLQAARCSACDWGLTFRRPEPTNPGEMVMPARFLAYCLLKEGERARRAGDLEAAVNAHLAGVRLASDLRLTNLLGNLIAIDVARMGLLGLGRLITSAAPPDLATLRAIDDRLAKLLPYVAGAGEGPRVERLEFRALMQLEAEHYAADRNQSLGSLLPWHAITAFHMHQVDRLLRRADMATTAGDVALRPEVGKPIPASADVSWSQILTLGGVPSWNRVRENEDELLERYRMVWVAVRLEEWHRQRSRYPENVSSLELPFEMPALRYEPTENRQGYRVHSVSSRPSVRKTAKLVLERRPKASGS
jgi:hypothetical protein